jgi:hypothetical protein
MSRFKFLSVSEVMALPSPQWRVNGLLPVGALSMLYAPQEQAKTFFALDLALSIASGTPFHGRKAKQGPVVYILSEGRGGLKHRLAAWMAAHPDADLSQFIFLLDAVQFRTGVDDVQYFCGEIEGRNLCPALIVIDTFARSAVGVDENNARDVGLWIDAVRRIQQRLGKDGAEVDVLVLHHAQKGSAEGGPVRERGSSAFVGATDTVIRLKRADTSVSVHCEKMKDAAHFKPFTLQLKVMELGVDEYGEAASSCVLVDSDEIPGAQNETLAAEHLKLLTTLCAFPQGTADRKDWLPLTGLKDRSFDRHRDFLLAKGYIVATISRGQYRITPLGDLAIASNSPTVAKVTGPTLLPPVPTPHRGGDGDNGDD